MKLSYLLILLFLTFGVSENPCPDCQNGCSISDQQISYAVYCPSRTIYKNGIWTMEETDCPKPPLNYICL